MTKNVTLRMDEGLLRKLRHCAVDEGKSLSAWVATVLGELVEDQEGRDELRKQALSRLNKGYHLGGKPLSREEAHGR